MGDVFQLGSSTWRIAAIEHDRVVVTPAPGTPARMPFWHGEYMARSLMLSHRVGALRRELAEAPDEERLAEEYGCDAATANSLVKYIATQRAATGIVPDDRNIVIEQFRDETGAVRIVIHAAFGGRINAPWGMALAKRVREALNDVDLQVQTTDDGIMLRLPDLGMSAPIQSLLGLSGAEAEQLVMEEVGSTSLFGARFRMNAARALLLPRGNPRRRMPLWLQRLKSLDLLQTVSSSRAFRFSSRHIAKSCRTRSTCRVSRRRCSEIAGGNIRVHTVQTDVAVTVRGEPAVRLRDGLAVRRRHSASGAAGCAPVARSVTARRSDGWRRERRHHTRRDRADSGRASRNCARPARANERRARAPARSSRRSDRRRGSGANCYGRRRCAR